MGASLCNKLKAERRVLRKIIKWTWGSGNTVCGVQQIILQITNSRLLSAAIAQQEVAGAQVNIIGRPCPTRIPSPSRPRDTFHSICTISDTIITRAITCSRFASHPQSSIYPSTATISAVIPNIAIARQDGRGLSINGVATDKVAYNILRIVSRLEARLPHPIRKGGANIIKLAPIDGGLVSIGRI